MTRFELETAIMACWQSAEDIDMLVDYLYEEEPDLDFIANTLLGLKNLQEIRMTRLWNVFSELVNTRQFVDDQRKDSCCGQKKPCCHPDDVYED